jgi:hypothetical protein
MLRVAVDFDGTIVENEYPRMGRPLLFAFETLKELQKRGFVLILWTLRTGKLLDEAVEFCRQNGIEFYAVNRNHPEEVMDTDTPRKLEVDIFIDDRNLGGFPGWEEVFNILCPDEPYEFAQKKVLKQYRKKSFIRRILGA